MTIRAFSFSQDNGDVFLNIGTPESVLIPHDAVPLLLYTVLLALRQGNHSRYQLEACRLTCKAYLGSDE